MYICIDVGIVVLIAITLKDKVNALSFAMFC
jgi:hypothetical protein